MAVIRALNRLFYNLNNGFHQQEKKVLSKKQYFFFLTEKCVFTSRDEELLEKYLRQ